MPAQQSRFMCFTLNNCRINGHDLLSQWHADNKIVYGAAQLEQAPSTKTEHLQGYVVCDKKRTLSWCQKNLFQGHWEIRKGTHDEARLYCVTDEYKGKKKIVLNGPWEVGHWDASTEGPAGAGNRVKNQMLDVKKMIDEGATNRELYQAHFGLALRYKKNFDDYRLTMAAKVRDWHTKCLVLWGPPGTGKSTRAHELSFKLFGDQVYWWRANEKWWDGYEGQPCVVIDEFYGQAQCNFMLRLLDRFPLQVETKGSTVAFLAKMVIITSNKHPETWYGPDDPTTSSAGPHGVPVVVRDALLRRMQGSLGTIKKMEQVIPQDDDEVDFEEELNGLEAYADSQDRAPPPSRVPLDLSTDFEQDLDENGDFEAEPDWDNDPNMVEADALDAAAQDLEDQHLEENWRDIRRMPKSKVVDVTDDDDDNDDKEHSPSQKYLAPFKKPRLTRQLSFKKPPPPAGTAKKTGSEPVQSKLSFQQSQRLDDDE